MSFPKKSEKDSEAGPTLSFLLSQSMAIYGRFHHGLPEETAVFLRKEGFLMGGTAFAD